MFQISPIVCLFFSSHAAHARNEIVKTESLTSQEMQQAEFEVTNHMPQNVPARPSQPVNLNDMALTGNYGEYIKCINRTKGENFTKKRAEACFPKQRKQRRAKDDPYPPNHSELSLWPQGKIPYLLRSGDFNHIDRRVIANSIVLMNRVTSDVKWFQANDQQKAHTLIWKRNDSETLSAATVGYQGPESRHHIKLCPACVDWSTMIHEMMHVMGFPHEHQRSDRDQYVNIHWADIEDQLEYNFAPMPNYDGCSPYGFDSIMHYDAYAAAEPGKGPTITSKINGTRLGLSIDAVYEIPECDKKAIQCHYCNASVTTAPNVDNM